MDPQDDFCAVNVSVCVVFKRFRLKILDSILLDPHPFVKLALSTLILDKLFALALNNIVFKAINEEKSMNLNVFLGKLSLLLSTIIFP